MPRGAAAAAVGAGAGAAAGHAPRDRAQAEERKQRVEHGERRQRRERACGFGKRQSARRLPEQHRHVPAHRQDRAPGLRERVHPEGGKADAGIAERRRDDEAGQAETSREVAHQKLHQRAQCQIADDQQRRRNDDHRHVALERNPEQSLQNERHRQHDDEENPEQRRELAGQRHDRIAARASEPGAHAAAAELGAHRIAGRDRDDHMQHHRQQRAQQKLGVVPLRIDQNDGLGDERADARCFRRRALGRALGGGGEAVAEPRRRDARGGEELLIIEADHLRAAPGLQIALEIGRHVDGADGLAGADRARGRRRGRRRARRC